MLRSTSGIETFIFLLFVCVSFFAVWVWVCFFLGGGGLNTGETKHDNFFFFNYFYDTQLLTGREDLRRTTTIKKDKQKKKS